MKHIEEPMISEEELREELGNTTSAQFEKLGNAFAQLGCSEEQFKKAVQRMADGFNSVPPFKYTRKKMSVDLFRSIIYVLCALFIIGCLIYIMLIL